VLIKILSGPSSCERLFARPTIPGRIVLERTRLSMLCFIDEEARLTICPRCCCCIYGITSLVARIKLSKLNSKAWYQSSSFISRNFPAGGPPALLMSTSTVLFHCAAFSTTDLIVLASFISQTSQQQ